jgi:hypothetical protein
VPMQGGEPRERRLARAPRPTGKRFEGSVGRLLRL